MDLNREPAKDFSAINSREEELSEIARMLFTSEPNSVSAHMSRIRQFVYERLGNIRELLYTDVPRAKAELAKHVTSIEMAPRQEGKQGHYVAIGEWNLLGGIEGNLNECETERVRIGCGGWI